MIRALLFDLYDTLVKPDWPLLSAARAALARELGVEPETASAEWKRTHPQRMIGAWGSLAGDLAQVFAAAKVAPELLERLAERELANWSSGVQPYPEVPSELSRLREAGYRLAIVSNASHEAASAVEALGLDRLVDAAIVSCRVGALKPEPAIFEAALRELGSAPDETLLVDDLAVNLDGAARLSIRGVLMDRVGDGPPATDAYPVAHSLTDLWALLEREPEPAARR